MFQNNDNSFATEYLKQTISITKIGVFIWNLVTDHVVYSKEWAEIVGYELEELESHVSTWESMLLPSDLKIAEKQVDKYLSGELPHYEAEFRMRKKDGTIIWGHDKGKVTQYTQDGKPLILCGVLQDITSIKNTEQKLRESTDVLNLAIEVAEFGTWDWNLEKDLITYNDEYLKMLGYTQDEITGSLSEWEDMNHPEDLVIVSKLLDDFVDGKSPSYECEIRMRHKDGHYIWTKDVGRIVSKDENGKALRVLGGHLNIDGLKKSQSKLQDTLKELENHQEHLEKEIEQRTKKLIEQDNLLMTVNSVSQKMLAIDVDSDFDSVLLECLKNLTFAYNTADFTLWRYFNVAGKEFFCMTHDYKRKNDTKTFFDIQNMQEYIESVLEKGDEFEFHIKDDGNVIINYSVLPQHVRYQFENEKAVNNITSDVDEDWIKLLGVSVDNCNSVLFSLIYLYNNIFGLIATGNEMKGVVYSEAHESMIDISGKLFANAQKKHEMDEQLRHAHEEAILSSQAKSNFLANMSHEIRTPLNAILGMAEIVLRESKGRATEEYAVEIKNASESLLIIINDILDISKIESGKLEIINVEYNITSLLNDVISITKMRIEDKPVILTAFIESSMPAKLIGDEIRIKQVLLNLLSNATKFTKKGNIFFSATTELLNGVAHFKFIVKDTGMGIKEEDMERLFMQFERVDTKKNRNIEGTGLGLAITKQLCEMMGGTISVTSTKGEGSEFTVCIPQHYNEYEPIATAQKMQSVLLYEARELYAQSIKQSLEDLGCNCTICSNQSELLESITENKFSCIFTPAVHASKIKSLKRKMALDIKIILMTDPGDMAIYRDDITVSLPLTCIQLGDVLSNSDNYKNKKVKTNTFIAPEANVLVVDDNNVNLKVAKGLMAPYKFNLETALNGALAIEMVKSNNYDLVFMDHMMPEMDGIDTTAAIRKLDGDYFKNLPIVALTANALVGARELFVTEGMNDFLAKPIEMKKLNEVLLKWIPKHKQQEATFEPTYAQAHYDISIDDINTDYGIKMIGGVVEDYYDILNGFYVDALKRIDSISSALAKNDMDSYRIDMHTLKSVTGSIGAFNISEDAKRLEKAAEKNDVRFIQAHTDDFLNNLYKLLDDINMHLKTTQKDKMQGKEKGNCVFLESSINEVEAALVSLDIDTIEKALQDCMNFLWEGDINEMLVKIKQMIDSFEYYNARPLLEELRDEMRKIYN